MPDFSLIDVAPQPTAVVRGNVSVPDLPAFFDRALPAVWTALQSQGLAPAGPPFACYHGVPDETADVEAGFPVGGAFSPSCEVVAGELPGGRVVTAMHVGPYDTLAQTYDAMSAWAAERGLKPTETMWEAYLTDPSQVPGSSQWQTQISIQVA